MDPHAWGNTTRLLLVPGIVDNLQKKASRWFTFSGSAPLIVVLCGGSYGMEKWIYNAQWYGVGGNDLTHWGGVTHICVGNLTIIGPDNGLSPGRRQAIIWTNAGILLIGPWGTNFSEILIGIHTFSFKKIHLKLSSAKLRRFVSASMC